MATLESKGGESVQIQTLALEDLRLGDLNGNACASHGGPLQIATLGNPSFVTLRATIPLVTGRHEPKLRERSKEQYLGI